MFTCNRLLSCFPKGGSTWACAHLCGRAVQDTIIQRGVTQVLTPGTLVDDSLIADYKSQFLVSLRVSSDWRVAVCAVDCTASEGFLGEFQDDLSLTKLETFLIRIRPTEVLYSKVRQT